MSSLLPPHHIEHYKRQVDIKTDNLRFETVNFVRNFHKCHNHLPCFPWTFDKTFQTLRLLCEAIGYRNRTLEMLPGIIEVDLFRAVGAFPPGYVPKLSTDGKTLTGGMMPVQLMHGKLADEAMIFRQQMFTYIYLHHLLYRRLPPIPHSFVIGFNYLLLKRTQTGEQFLLERLPLQLNADLRRVIRNMPNGYIPMVRR